MQNYKGLMIPRFSMFQNSQERILLWKGGACGSREDLNQLITCQTQTRNALSTEKRRPVEGGKTSPNSLHVRMIREHCFLPKAKGRPHPAYYMSDDSSNRFFC